MERRPSGWVTLIANGVTRQFEITHAERLLRWKNNGGWALPEGSKFIYEDGCIKYRPNQGGGEKTAKSGVNIKGRKASE